MDMSVRAKTESGQGGCVLVSRRGPAAVVVLNRPEVHNALDEALLGRLCEVLQELDRDGAVRAIVLTGAGTSFCSGDDLRVARSGGAGDFARSVHGLQRVAAHMFALSKPIIGALNGPAFGGGLELTLGCDMRICTPGFLCATPEVRLGLIMTNAASVLLPLLIGPSRAARMLLTGARVEADWCLDAGLVDEIVPPEALLDRALALAGEVAGAGPEAVAATRRLLNAPLAARIAAALEAEAEACVDAGRSPEAAEGLAAFFDKRVPRWPS
jgi:enoyl-CoA hydratase/carnithine racemase